MTADTPTDTRTRLQGRWLWAARLAWIALALLSVGLYVAAIPNEFDARNLDCAARPCAPSDLQAAAILQKIGLSGSFAAWYAIVVDSVLMVVFTATGALIFWRRSDNRMALLTSAMLLASGATFGPAIATLAAVQPSLQPLSLVLGLTAWGSFATFFFVFPDGRFVPSWSKWLLGPYLVALAVVLAVTGASAYYSPLFFGVLFLGMGSGGAAQIYRYRRVATPMQRQQTKWVSLGFVIPMGLAVIGILPGMFNPAIMLSPLYHMIRVPLTAVLPLLMLPLGLAFSMLRYRLWDVDFVINRALVYGALTVLLGGLFAGGFFLLNAILERLLGVGQNVAAAGASAAIVVALFNPTRRWLRNFVDRRFYGIQIEYTPSPAPTAAGAVRTHFGPYTALEFIGRGGMAEVYRAAQPSTGKVVAVKIMSGALTSDAEFRKRFDREAKMASALQHPNIVKMVDFGEADGTPYMAMEYLGGGDLGDHLKSKGRLPLAEAQPLIKGIASALDYAHAQGLVHRDIKPSNVMLDAKDEGRGMKDESSSFIIHPSSLRAVLTDFGIAKMIGGHTRYTQTGGMLGTFDYIAPEQIQGAATVDGRADVYAFGVMVYQMLAGELPFKHNNPGALLIAHLSQPPPDARDRVPELPRETTHAIQKAMAKNPAERFATAGEFAAALM